MDLKNNYLNKNYLEFYKFDKLDPHVINKNDFWYPQQGIGLSFIIFPLILLKNIFILRVFFAFLTSLFLLFIYSLNLKLFYNKKISFFIVLIQGLSLPIFSMSIFIFPDVLAGLIIIYLFNQYFSRKNNKFLIKILIFFLPWLQVRFLVFSLFFTFMFSNKFKNTRFLFTSFFLISFYFLFYFILFGNFIYPILIYYKYEHLPFFSIKNLIPNFINIFLNINKGLLINSPFYFFFIFSLFFIFKEKNKKIKEFFNISLPIIFFYLIVISLYNDWGGGWSPASRYFIPIIGLMSVYINKSVFILIKNKKTIFIFLFAFFSIFISLTIPFTNDFGFSLDNNTEEGINLNYNQSIELIFKFFYYFYNLFF